MGLFTGLAFPFFSKPGFLLGNFFSKPGFLLGNSIRLKEEASEKVNVSLTAARIYTSNKETVLPYRWVP